MTKEIILEKPYSDKWRKGYIVTNPEGRQNLILFNSRKDRSTTQYARYLLAVKLGRLLSPKETVDHIDGDITNNDLDNLQILSRAENIRKSCKKPDVELICPNCTSVFYRTRTQLRGRTHRIETNSIYCSRKCSYQSMKKRP